MAENKDLTTRGSADLALRKASSLLSVTDKILARHAARQLTNEVYYQPFQDQLKDGGLAPVMIHLKGGKFVMGSLESETERYHECLHQVTVSDFAIGQAAVTFADYDIFCKATHKTLANDRAWGRGLHPIINIDWFDAMAYCAWLSIQTGKKYRLPTEAEWEYACRADTMTFFSFGNNITPDFVNYHGHAPYAHTKKGRYREKTVTIKSLPPNAWGLYEMHGNVWEWCRDGWTSELSAKPVINPITPVTDSKRVVRGGSWHNGAAYARSACRGNFEADLRDSLQGFRLALEL